MLRASYRSAPRLWLPTAVVRPPGWKISACVKMHLALEILLLGARQSQEVKCSALGHALRSLPHSPTSFQCE